jgi:hypothetical protein
LLTPLKAQTTEAPAASAWDSFLKEGNESQLFDLLMDQRVTRTVDGQEVSLADVIGEKKALVVFMRHVG